MKCSHTGNKVFPLRGIFPSNKGYLCCHKTSHRITKEEKSGKIVANQGIGMETAE